MATSENSGAGDISEFYGSAGIDPASIVDGGSDASSDSGNGSGANLSGGGGGGPGNGNTDPRSAFGAGSADRPNDDDDRYIRDDNGNILLSPTGRKRRRRRGSEPRAAKGQEKTTKLSVSSVEAILLSSHQMLSVVTGLQSIDIGKAKADMLATGIVNVARHYPNSAIDPRLVDWFNLFMACGICYQPVASEIRDNIRSSRAEKRGAGRTSGGPVAVPDTFAPTPQPGAVHGATSVSDPFTPIDFTTLKPAPPIQ